MSNFSESGHKEHLSDIETKIPTFLVCNDYTSTILSAYETPKSMCQYKYYQYLLIVHYLRRPLGVDRVDVQKSR